MAPKKRTNAPKSTELKDCLVRTAYINSLFGVKSFKTLQSWLAETDEGIEESDGHTNFFHVLKTKRTFKEQGSISIDKLAEYDDNLCKHMSHINEKRETPIHLKYYQWLAALYTEIYLDKYFSNKPGKLAGELENVLYDFQATRNSFVDPFLFAPTAVDLRKCGFWMATGSGKTFIIHLNYLQFLHYNKGPHKLDIDRVLLITPNANLTAQHIREFEKSNIKAAEFRPDSLDCYFTAGDDSVIQVLEITKLVDKKTDDGKKRVDVSAFGKKNLVFVDEAHKGSGSDSESSGWKSLRDRIAKEGWMFEYSATFGQAASDEKDLLENFGKTILFDYSYPHFYNDGYGKEYRTLNVSKAAHDTDRVLLGNLLTYYEQKLLYSHITETANEYNIASPLWIFVGHSVKIPDVKKSEKQSDVLLVLLFINRFLKEKTWAKHTISEFLSGTSGLIDEKSKFDLFAPEFPEQRLRYLREQGLSADELYADILKRVFNCVDASGITLARLKDTDGEIGVKCGDNPFFAEIYIGDDSKFINEINKYAPDIYTETLNLPSLFKNIDNPDSTINILIGAKKFIEGWDCYRVSCMGLLNVGKSAGTEIIQLFGRGIRLRGKNYSLKRSTNRYGDQPQNLPLLETLNIFGVNAEYIGLLRQFFEHDGIPTANTIDRKITIQKRHDFLKAKLLIPKVSKTGFAASENIILKKSDIRPVIIDLRSKVETADSQAFEGIKAEALSSDQKIDAAYLDFVDWTKIYFELLDYKASKGWYNVIFTPELLREIIEDQETYTLYCVKDLICPASFGEMANLENVITLILRKLIHTAYAKQQNKWIYKHAVIGELQSDHENFENYTVHLKDDDEDTIQDIEKIIANMSDFIEKNNSNFVTNVYCEQHLFQPLLATKSSKVTLSPEGLNEGEQQFVQSLVRFVDDEENKEFFENHQLFLLRNLPRHGIGFYTNVWFYPDFILWVKNTVTNHQRLIFVDPKGLVHMNGFEDEKIRLHKDIKKLQKELNLSSPETPVELDSYIISNTSRENLKSIFGYGVTAEEYAEHHVLFSTDTHYVKKMIMGS